MERSFWKHGEGCPIKYNRTLRDISPNIASIDANHAQNKTKLVTRIQSCEGTTYHGNMRALGSEYTALKTATELIISLWYKLCMIGIPIEGAANGLMDNNSVLNYHYINIAEEAQFYSLSFCS